MTFFNVKNFFISWGLYPIGIKKSYISSKEYDLMLHQARYIVGSGSHIDFFLPVVLFRKRDKLYLPYKTWNEVRNIWRKKLP